jgi:predicted phosphoribosyltransferase
MRFASREDAGRKLGSELLRLGLEADGVLGLPRGGVVVAAEVARLLRCPLDVLVVRKIGHPQHREFAVGALAERGVVILDESVARTDSTVRLQLTQVIREEESRLLECERMFHVKAAADWSGKRIILVDDGLATGATMEAAVASAVARGAGSVIVAAPVASRNAISRLAPLTDEVVVLHVDPAFDAVGAYYDSFSQTSDKEVIALLDH